ncbi:MAG TPA: DUF4406 domain-containing protein [Bryobacteraceae bacterium]|nr:DUF4406 domain-containing protein [Bryobacteraceae bacterium]
MKRVYIAGKLNADACAYLQNVAVMIRTAVAVRRLGFSVFIPCLDLLTGVVAGDLTYHDYADNNMRWLEVADAVLVLPGWETSKGTRAEIARAEELGIPVYYSIEDLCRTSVSSAPDPGPDPALPGLSVET